MLAKQKLAELTNKNYSEWELNNRFRYFKMFSMHLRQDFNSLNYKQSIVDILEKYNFDLKKSDKEIREELGAAKTQFISDKTRINEYY